MNRIENLEQEFQRTIALIKAEQMDTPTLIDCISNMQQDLVAFQESNSRLEEEVRDLNKALGREVEGRREAEAELGRYKEAETNFKQEQWEFTENVRDFNAQKAYITRENRILGEILSSVLARKEINDSIFTDYVTPPQYCDSNGNWVTPEAVAHTRHESSMDVKKPNLGKGGFEE